MKWHDMTADGDVAEPWERAPVASRPSIQEIFFDGKVVRQARVEDGRESRDFRTGFIVTDVGDAYPNDDLGGLDLFSYSLDRDRGAVIEVGQSSNDRRHGQILSESPPSADVQFLPVEVIRNLRADAENNQLIAAEPPPEIFTIEVSFRRPNLEPLISPVGDPLIGMTLHQVVQFTTM